MIAVLTLGISSNLYSEVSIEKGKAKSAVCAACHGADGNGLSPTFPNLAGQHVSYIVKQIKDFKSGKRSDPLMTSQANLIADGDIESIALYFSMQDVKPAKAASNLVKGGEEIYRGGDSKKGISACIACHGPQGKGISFSKYPQVSGQQTTYVESQLNNFKSGKRTNDLNGIMRDIAKKMSSEDIKAVASYMRGLH